MIRINDYVNYSTHGICKVEDIAEMQFSDNVGKREYYILCPVFQQKTKLYVPTDNPAAVQRMRRLLSSQEIDQIILSAKNQNMPWIPNYKERKIQFDEIMSRRDEGELLLLISCLYLRSHDQEKRLTSGDLQILKKAEHVIEQEFAFLLNISPQKVGNYIQEKLGLTPDSAALCDNAASAV